MTKTLDWDELDADVQSIVDIVANGDGQPVLDGPLKALLLQSHRDAFTSSVGPDGQAWPPRVDPGDGHPLLVESGALMQAATGGGVGHVYRSSPREMEAGVDKGVQEGGIPGAAAHNWGFAPRGLPQREWLGMKEDHQIEGADAVADHFLELIDQR